MKFFSSATLILSLYACTTGENAPQESGSSQQFITVLGIAQDAGFPQAGCEKEQCALVHQGIEQPRHATSLALTDLTTGQQWMFEATPDFKHQFRVMKKEAPESEFAGIFLTHAHIGHYTGLMQLGHEVMGASGVPVYSMPRMTEYLSTNGPWSQLVNFGNIDLKGMTADSAIELTNELSVTPFLVPHRDEYSETVGYIIASKQRSVLFIPDINKWSVWKKDIISEIEKVDVALLDGTFYNSDELPGRDMSEIPHPFIEESLELFKDLPDSEKSKITFIHFNHTNPLILDSPERVHVEGLGFNVAFEGMLIRL